MVVGSKDGQIRMYNEGTLTRAQTRLPSLGASITAVDVTFDSKWVLATTDSFLLVICTSFKVSAPRTAQGHNYSLKWKACTMELHITCSVLRPQSAVGSRFAACMCLQLSSFGAECLGLLAANSSTVLQLVAFCLADARAASQETDWLILEAGDPVQCL